MNKLLHRLVIAPLSHNRRVPDSEFDKYILMLAVALVACSVHVLFAVFFALIGCPPLSVGHAIGVFVFVACSRLLERRQYDIAGLLLGIMILSSTFETIYFVGGDNYSIFYQVTVLLMMMVVPFSNKKISTAASLLLPLVMVASHLFDINHTPGYDIGRYNDLLAIMNILVNGSGVVIMLSLERVVRTIIDRYKQQRLEELEGQAYLDPLTGLHNRRFVDNYLTELAQSPPRHGICVAFGDLDNFKCINDTFGHEAGDLALKTAARIMMNNTRTSDLVCRWGGEEFLLILRGISLENAELLLNKLREKVAATEVAHGQTSFSMSITLGVTRLDLTDIQASLDRSDRNLYSGKHLGKNCVVAR